jgi:hypothetical protein
MASVQWHGEEHQRAQLVGKGGAASTVHDDWRTTHVQL